MTASFPASATLNAPPIARPDKVSELIQGEFMMVADPVRLKLASCERVNKIVGSIGSGFEIELNVPLKVPLHGLAVDAVQVPARPEPREAGIGDRCRKYFPVERLPRPHCSVSTPHAPQFVFL
jgi:hypothetical protein